MDRGTPGCARAIELAGAWFAFGSLAAPVATATLDACVPVDPDGRCALMLLGVSAKDGFELLDRVQAGTARAIAAFFAGLVQAHAATIGQPARAGELVPFRIDGTKL